MDVFHATLVLTARAKGMYAMNKQGVFAWVDMPRNVQRATDLQ